MREVAGKAILVKYLPANNTQPIRFLIDGKTYSRDHALTINENVLQLAEDLYGDTAVVYSFNGDYIIGVQYGM